MDLVLEQQIIEKETYFINFYSFCNKIFSLSVLDRFFTRSVNKSLQAILTDVERLDLVQEKLVELKHEELFELYSQIKKLNKLFDKMHDKASSANYMNDSDVQKLFKTISRKLHKRENLLQRYNSKHLPFAKTPDHIKNQIFQFSNEAVTKTLYK